LYYYILIDWLPKNTSVNAM